MEVQESWWDWLRSLPDQLPDDWRPYWPAIAAAVGLVVLLILYALLERLLLRPLFRQRRPDETEKHLREDLAALGPPPGEPGPRRLLVDGVPVRLRLVVVARVGHEPLDLDPQTQMEMLLNRVLPGLGAAAAEDQPAVRVWPAQVSKAGFAPKLHQLVRVPEPPGEPSRWVVLAGPARAGLRHFLLGLALYADEPTYLGRKTLPEDRWSWSLRLQELPKEN